MSTPAEQVRKIYDDNWAYVHTTYEALIEHLKAAAKHGSYEVIVNCDHMLRSSVNDLHDMLSTDGFTVEFYNGDATMLEVTFHGT